MSEARVRSHLGAATVAVAGLLLAVSSLAGEVAVPLYTNADLRPVAATEPGTPEAPAESSPSAQAPGNGWRFVQEFLEREHARIDARRAQELERLRQPDPPPQPRLVLAPFFHRCRDHCAHGPPPGKRVRRPAPEPLLGEDAVPGPEPIPRAPHPGDRAVPPHPPRSGRPR